MGKLLSLCKIRSFMIKLSQSQKEIYRIQANFFYENQEKNINLLKKNHQHSLKNQTILGQFTQIQESVFKFYLLRYFIQILLKILILPLAIHFMTKKHNKEVHEYIVNKVNSFIEPLVYQLVLQRPNSPVEFAIQWLMKYNQKMKNKSCAQLDSDSEGECLDQVKELETKISQKKSTRTHHKSRVGISEEVFGLFNTREEISIDQKHELSQDQKILVKSLIRNSIFFKNLDSKDEEVILRAIKPKQTEQYELIIKQGQAGDVLYIVQSGQYDCYKLVEDENAYIKTYVTGEAFGQLALMYNAPRAASIVTKKPGKLLTLDRSVFSHILKLAALRKQDIIKVAIDKLQILRAIPIDERHQLINILKEQKYHEGEYVIKEGEEGDKFYVVLQGTLVAQKCEGHQLPNIVYKYQEGDYFGQLALINNEPRQASIRALTPVKVVYVTSLGFKRVFGGVTDALKQESQKYQ